METSQRNSSSVILNLNWPGCRGTHRQASISVPVTNWYTQKTNLTVFFLLFLSCVPQAFCPSSSMTGRWPSASGLGITPPAWSSSVQVAPSQRSLTSTDSGELEGSRVTSVLPWDCCLNFSSFPFLTFPVPASTLLYFCSLYSKQNMYFYSVFHFIHLPCLSSLNFWEQC